MIVYKCPNCGRVYREENEGWHQCMNCGYGLKKAEDVKSIAHPELNPMLSNKHVIGYTNNSSDNTPKCPKCGCTNIQVVRRNWSFFRGFATNKTDRVCINCNYKW